MNTIIEKIRAEIERLQHTDIPHTDEWWDGADYVRRRMKEVLSDLEKETTYDTHQYTPRPSVGIEDVARVQFASHAKVFDKKRKAVFDWEQFKEVAGIFYGFGKKDPSYTLEKEKKPIEGLEEEIKRFQKEIWDHDTTLSDVARHFAQWGAEHIKIESEKPVPADLEKAAEEYASDEMMSGLAERAFIAGAKWQAKQDQETIELAEDHAYLAGAVNEREKMMNEAVECEVTETCGISSVWIKTKQFKPGTKVKIIIVKEEGKCTE